MQEVFYPSYSYESADKGSATNVYLAETAKTYHLGPPSQRRGRPGKQMGTRVDAAITRCIKLDKAPTRQQRGASAFFMSCRDRGMRPTAAQVAVGDASLFLGTRADVVCKKESDVYLLEIKTGFANYLYRHTGSALKPPLQEFTDSPNNQHHLQLALTKHMYQQTYPDIAVKGCYVVYIRDTTVCWVSLNTRMESLLVDIVNALRVSAPIQRERTKTRFKSLKHRLKVMGEALKKRRKKRVVVKAKKRPTRRASK